MPRQTSTASSSKRAWPSTASSRRAHRSRSGSWRSPPGWGWRLERCLSRNAAGALGGAVHAANPAKYGSAGGVENLRGALRLLTQIGTVAAVLIGVNAGGSDLAAGVFRELVVTGRSRLALFAARIPGGLALLLPLVAIAV